MPKQKTRTALVNAERLEGSAYGGRYELNVAAANGNGGQRRVIGACPLSYQASAIVEHNGPLREHYRGGDKQNDECECYSGTRYSAKSQVDECGTRWERSRRVRPIS